MVNNIDTILPLLKFETKGDFVTVLILKRKKDCTTNTNNHQSVRTIKAYTIYSEEQLVERFDEMKLLCETFEARAYINFNTKNDKNVALKMISKIADRVESGNDNCKHVYDSVIGELKPKQKRWIIDIDKEDLTKVDEIVSFINNLEPIGEQKLITKVSTLSGLHLITNPFRLDLFTKEFPKIDVQKNNPTCLYIPKSLTNFVEEEIASLRHENYMLKKELSQGIAYFDNLIEDYEKTHNLFVEIIVGYNGFGYFIYHKNPNEFWLASVYNSDDRFPTRELARIDCLKYLQNTDLNVMKNRLLKVFDRVKRNNSHIKRYDTLFEDIEIFMRMMSYDFDKREYRELIRFVRKHRGQMVISFKQRCETPIYWEVCETLISRFNECYKDYKREHRNTFYFKDDWGYYYILKHDGWLYKILDVETYFPKYIGDNCNSKNTLEEYFKMNPLTFITKDDFFNSVFNNNILSIDELESNLEALSSIPKISNNYDFGYIILIKGDKITFTKYKDLIRGDDEYYVSKNNIEHLFECTIEDNVLVNIEGIAPNIILKSSQMKKYFDNINVNYKKFIINTFLDNEGRY